MKVVCCKNCGAKYQLDDDDDISTFECSSCAGDLEYLEGYSDKENTSSNPFGNTFKYENSYIVQCQDCGLKYKIKNNDSILDYECDSCGGSLRYLNDDMNKELDKYIEERKKEAETFKRESKVEKPISEESDIPKEDRSLRSIPTKIGNFFSEEHMLKIADDERKQREMEKEQEVKTARTTIPKSVLNRFGKEFAVPKTEDYDILKSFLKDEFFKSMNVYYPRVKSESESPKGLLDKISLKEPNNSESTPITTPLKEEEPEESSVNNLDTSAILLVVGFAIFIMSIIEILLINSSIGIVTLLIGVIMLCYGIYKTRDVKQTEIRTKIIREHLLTLPEEYYVFYNVKIPTSSSSINHLVVGPTGIYALLSQKYNPKIRLESENENLNIIGSTELDEDRIEKIPQGTMRRFRYTTKQAKFSQDNKIKQKSLSLGEDLINFLNDNDIKNCFVEPLIGFINNEVVVINMPLTDEDLFIDELLNKIQTGTIKLNQETIDKCAVLINKYSADCSAEI